MPRIIISEPGKTPQPYRLKTDRIVTKIGRASDNDVIITTGSASTYHCKMKRIEGGFILVDNNSTNGIKHDDTRFSVIDLEDGMTVQIGDDNDLEFTLSEDELDILEQEDFEPQQKISFPKSKKKPGSKKKPESKKEPESEIEPPGEEDIDAIVLEEAKTKTKSKSKSSSDDADISKPKLKTKSKLKTDTDTDKPATASRPVATTSNSSLSLIIFIILAVLFFVGGLAVRHYQDHKTFIFSK